MFTRAGNVNSSQDSMRRLLVQYIPLGAVSVAYVVHCTDYWHRSRGAKNVAA